MMTESILRKLHAALEVVHDILIDEDMDVGDLGDRLDEIQELLDEL